MNNKNEKFVLNLPQCEFVCSSVHYTEWNKILFSAGGRKTSKEWFLQTAKDKKVWAVDKGIEICRELKIFPELLLGDFDSSNSSAVEWAKKNNVPVERHPVDKDLTDTQLALLRASEIDKNFFAIITGIFGGRADHLYSTIYSCTSAKIKNCLADDKEIIFFLRDGESVNVNFFEKPVAVSLLPISEICEGVTLKNVHWELDNAVLKKDFPNAVSNRIESNKIKASISKGTLAIYFCFDEKNL